jgi:ACR3 family arsenite efflux pump ArsB
VKHKKDKEAEEERGLCETRSLINSKSYWIPNWKQRAVLLVAILIFYGLYKHFISKYSVTIIIAIAAAFFCFAIFVSSIFRDKKQAIEYMSERKKSCSDDSKREVNNR